MAVGQDDREKTRQASRDWNKLSDEGKAFVMAAARRMDSSTNQRNRMIRNELRSQPSGTGIPKYGKTPADKIGDRFKKAYNDPNTNLGALRRGANKIGKFFSGGGGGSDQRNAARRRLYAANKR